jgi:heme A synthase
MRYLIAAVIAALVIGSGLLYHGWANAMAAAHFERIRPATKLPEGTSMKDFNIRLTRQQILHIELDHFLVKFRYALVALVLTICFAGAALFPRSGRAGDRAKEP